MRRVDLNADVGEGAASAADEGALIAAVTSASIGCGAHAGTPVDMAEALAAAVSAGVVIGAHPSYPDRAGFGRRPLDLGSGELLRSLCEQIATLDALVRAAGDAVRYVKPHGALYHRACTDEKAALVLAEAAVRSGVAVLLLAAGAPTTRALSAAGLSVVGEAFVDRAYLADGSLVPRNRPDAVVRDPDAAVDQALSLVTARRAPVAGGGFVEVSASSLCLHGDTPGAAALARGVRRALEEAGVELSPFAR